MCAITIAFDVTEAALFTYGYFSPTDKLYTLTQACTLAKGKTANTDSRYALGIAHDFGMLWKQCGFLTSSGNKIEKLKTQAPIFRNYWILYFYLLL